MTLMTLTVKLLTHSLAPLTVMVNSCDYVVQLFSERP